MKIAFVFNLQRELSADEAEFDTRETIAAITSALASRGDEVVQVEMTRRGEWMLELESARPDIVFNTAEGFCGIGRESLAPIAFEQMGLSYVGSGPYTCFLTLDKSLTKLVVAGRGVPTPESHYVTDPRELEGLASEVVYPVFVKPNFEGSSKGISERSYCADAASVLAYGRECLEAFPEGILVERYVDGRDVTVPWVGGLGKSGTLAPIEYVGPLKGGRWIYDYELKNLRDDEVGVRCPAELEPEVGREIERFTRVSVHALGVLDMGRLDFRVTPSGEVFFIEFNALPSLQPGAGLFAAARLLGLSYNETIQKILDGALERLRIRRRGTRPARRLETSRPRVALIYNLKRKEFGDEGFEAEAEFDSEATVEAIAAAIGRLRYEVVPIEATRELASRLGTAQVDVAFNIAEGVAKRGREAQVPAVCDLLGVEHTGSDATCLAITLDKALTCRLMAADGLRTPKAVLYSGVPKRLDHGLSYPVIVKPNFEGTSKGIHDSSVVHDEAGLMEVLKRTWEAYRSPMLCQEYVTGREFTVGVLGRGNLRVLGPLEIAFRPEMGDYPVYSFAGKHVDNPLDNEFFRMICPAEISPGLSRRIGDFARRTFRTAGCRDVARIDLRVTPEEEIFFLEINPLPGLSPQFGDLVIMAGKSGWTYDQVIRAILAPAVDRWRLGRTGDGGG